MVKVRTISSAIAVTLAGIILSALIPFLPIEQPEPVCYHENILLESDPCHLAIYHHNLYPQKECHHKAHLTKKIIHPGGFNWLHVNKFYVSIIENRAAVSLLSFYRFFFQRLHFSNLHFFFSNKSPPSILAISSFYWY